MRTTNLKARTLHDVAVRFAPARWWASSLLIAGLGLVGGITSLLAREPIAVSLCLFALTVVAGTGRLRAREEFRRGWRYGYESATRVMLERTAGRVTDVEARASVHGDPTPEPWDQHVPITVVRGAR